MLNIMRKRHLSMILVLSLVLSLVPMNRVHAEEGVLDVADRNAMVADLAVRMVNREASVTYSYPGCYADCGFISTNFFQLVGGQYVDGVHDGTYLMAALKTFTVSASTGADGKEQITFSIVYDTTKDQENAIDARINQAVASCSGGSTYDKIRAAHDYVTSSISYGDGSLYSAICEGTGDCRGYAIFFYRIMKGLGVPVTYQVGGNHAWNTVSLDGATYSVDCTYDDGVGGYTYFLTDANGTPYQQPTSQKSTAPSQKSTAPSQKSTSTKGRSVVNESVAAGEASETTTEEVAEEPAEEPAEELTGIEAEIANNYYTIDEIGAMIFTPLSE